MNQWPKTGKDCLQLKTSPSNTACKSRHGSQLWKALFTSKDIWVSRFLLSARKTSHSPGFAGKLSAPIQMMRFVNCLETHRQLQAVNSSAINMLVRTTITAQIMGRTEGSLKCRLLSTSKKPDHSPAPAHILTRSHLSDICWQTLANVSACRKVFCQYSNILQIKPNELSLTKKCHVASLQWCPSVGLVKQQRAAAVPLCFLSNQNKAVHPRVRYDKQASKLPYTGIIQLLICLTFQSGVTRWLLTVGEISSVMFLALSWRDVVQKSTTKTTDI